MHVESNQILIIPNKEFRYFYFLLSVRKVGWLPCFIIAYWM